MTIFRETATQMGRDIHTLSNTHFPVETVDMGFHALRTTVATYCQDRITDSVPTIRRIIEILELGISCYPDIHLCDFKPSSYRLYNGDFPLKQFQFHTQSKSYWVLLKDYSFLRSELPDDYREDEVYIYEKEIIGPDYKNKTTLEDFLNGGRQLYLDGRDDCFIGCSYRASDKNRDFCDDSIWDFHSVQVALRSIAGWGNSLGENNND